MDGWQIDIGDRRKGAPRRPLAVLLAECLVVLVILTSFYVRSDQTQDNPSPYDLMMAGTIALLFLLGLRFPRRLGPPAAFWGLIVAGFGIGAMDALYMERVKPALMTTVYLVGSFLFFASWVYADPMRRLSQIFWAYTAAAAIAAALGIVGYFGLLPGAEIFTEYGRARGTFNDPNVFGPFLVAPVLFLAWKLSTAQSVRALWMVLPLGVLVLALLLSFSRGAWGNLLFAGLVFFGLTLSTSKSYLQTMRLIFFGALAVVVMVGVVGFALSSPKVADLFAQRASLTQSYDTDPDHGRFQSQSRALAMALEKPLGLGPAQWAMINKLDTHNVYLHILVGGGFLSGLAFIALIIVTLVRGWRAIGRDSPEQGILIVIYAAVLGHVGEAVIIDIDNWRHFYLLMGTLWGVMLAVEERGGVRRRILRMPSRGAPDIAPGASGFQT
jgi:O-antigen ligase